MTWLLAHLYENIPLMGAFSFHQDVFLDVQPNIPIFYFFPMSPHSGALFCWLI